MLTSTDVFLPRYGYKGFYDRAHKPIVLTRKVVEGIQLQGGTILVRRLSLWQLYPGLLIWIIECRSHWDLACAAGLLH